MATCLPESWLGSFSKTGRITGDIVSPAVLESEWKAPALIQPHNLRLRRIAFHAFSKPSAQASTTSSGWANNG